jgi:hypothetical protein
MNGFSYVEGNPINYTDPSGHNLCIPFPNQPCIPVNPPVVTEIIGLVTVCSANGVCALALVAGGTVAVLVYLGNSVTYPNPLCSPTRIPVPPATGTPGYPNTRTGTGENPFTLPYQYRAPAPAPEPKPGSTPVPREDPFALANFTQRLNQQLNPLNTYVYMAPQWHNAELADYNDYNSPTTFGLMFDQATTRAEWIHFSLRGITVSTINYYINSNGASGDFQLAHYWTVAELYRIKNNNLCSKTTFYTGIGGNLSPSESAKRNICGNS